MIEEYISLILGFVKKGYVPIFFTKSPPENNGLILRHDIDFDIEYAYRLSMIEDEMDIKSTYFFLMHSRSYNLLESKHLDQIKSIKSRGHQISIHFDPTLYTDIEYGLLKERDLFEKLFDTPVEYISIHRPSDYFLRNPNSIAGINHTYHPVYLNKIKYFSDSQGQFRHGHPLYSEEFKNLKTIQLLIHPIWWVTKSTHPVSKLQEFLDYRIDQFKQHMAFNCKPYKEYLEKP